MLAMGINCSTQSISAEIVDAELGVTVHRCALNFGQSLGDFYGVRDGFIDTGTGTVYAPPLMFAHGLGVLFEKLAAEFPRLNEIGAIAGAGQQHGTVYLNDTAFQALGSLDPKLPLQDQLRGIFSRPMSPIWRDSSTSAECQALAAALGGPGKVAEITGSVPTARFSLPQIMLFSAEEPLRFDRTHRVLLISAFAASLLTGEPAPVDYGDGSGTNLMNIGDRCWSRSILDACGCPGLRAKLPALVDPLQVLANISPYYVRRYGFNPNCKVLAFTGDNNDSLLGSGVFNEGPMVLSYGTSDTTMKITRSLFDPNGYGYVFAAVTGDNFGMTVHSNGSLTRQAIRDRFNLDWEAFGMILSNTKPGNRGKFMLPFLANEITPRTAGPVVRYYNRLDENDRHGCVRGVVEALTLNRWFFSRWLGEPETLLATGGGAQSEPILQVAADIFNKPVSMFESPNSVALGGAIRAAQALTGASWKDLTASLCKTTATIDPKAPCAYNGLKQEFAQRLGEAGLAG